MSVLYAYYLFALTTAVMAMWELHIPAVNAISDRTKNMIKHKYITYVVFFCMSLIFAPFYFYVCIKHSAGIIYRDRVIEIMSEA